MKRYRVKLLRYKDLKSFVIHLSADSVSCAQCKVNEFIQNAYGIGTSFFLVSVKQE